jgi:hypothetical protein
MKMMIKEKMVMPDAKYQASNAAPCREGESLPGMLEALRKSPPPQKKKKDTKNQSKLRKLYILKLHTQQGVNTDHL